MKFLIHNNTKVLELLGNDFKPIDFEATHSIVDVLFNVSKKYPDELIIWCHSDLKSFINKKGIKEIFHHKAIMASYSLNGENYIRNEIGYVDQSIFINVNRSIKYPTWLMSSDIGGIHSSIINTFLLNFKRRKSFSFFLNSVAKTAMPQGLFCYSEPNLIINKESISNSQKCSFSQLFRFVKEHYKFSWIFILFLNYFIHDHKILFLPLIKSLFYSKIRYVFDFSELDLQSTNKVIHKKEVDVILPTIGRKQYLYETLCDLANQTILPKNVIIVEQISTKGSKSELDYLSDQKWPFKIKHELIHELGACNARNIALTKVSSEWAFLADDDIRFKNNLIEKAFENIGKYGVNAISAVCLLPKQKQIYMKTSQTSIFGSGSSFVKSEILKKLKFDLSYEFNYGEDSDFGMQIRNLGEDIIFASNILITHLKAPIGGFRIKHNNPWDSDYLGPKPSPTIMLFNQRYLTKHQIYGYKTLLFIKFYKNQDVKNPFRYLSLMKKSWNSSLKWYQVIQQRSDA